MLRRSKNDLKNGQLVKDVKIADNQQRDDIEKLYKLRAFTDDPKCRPNGLKSRHNS